MERHLNLIKNELGISEKRILPRFPFCYLVFRSVKDQERGESKVFEIKDISSTGMQIQVKTGKHDYHKSSTFVGHIFWVGKELEVHGKVKWVTPNRVGLEFDKGEKLSQDIQNFLSLDDAVQHLKPLHGQNYDLDLPSSLKYWLRADGPIELFVWTHNDGEFKKFQIIVYENFVEWEDIQGLKTGRLLSKRDVDTPLITEDEFVFSIDQSIDEQREELAIDFIEKIPEEFLPPQAIEFIKLKLRRR